eukprot:scaffold13729_cov105-Isochrysis_galbana.AAC.1
MRRAEGALTSETKRRQRHKIEASVKWERRGESNSPLESRRESRESEWPVATTLELELVSVETGGGSDRTCTIFVTNDKRSVKCEVTHARHAQAPPQSQRLHSAVGPYPGYNDRTMN